MLGSASAPLPTPRSTHTRSRMRYLLSWWHFPVCGTCPIWKHFWVHSMMLAMLFFLLYNWDKGLLQVFKMEISWCHHFLPWPLVPYHYRSLCILEEAAKPSGEAYELPFQPLLLCPIPTSILEHGGPAYLPMASLPEEDTDPPPHPSTVFALGGPFFFPYSLCGLDFNMFSEALSRQQCLMNAFEWKPRKCLKFCLMI